MQTITAALEEILDSGTISPSLRVEMTLSNNRAFSPTVVTDNDWNTDVIVDGNDATSMVFAFTDSAHRTDDWARVWPDQPEDQLVPWRSRSVYRNGSWTQGAPTVTIDYGRLVRCNAIVMAFDTALPPTSVTVKVHDGSAWTTVASSIAASEEVILYLQNDDSWSTTKNLNNWTYLQKVAVTINGISGGPAPAQVREIDLRLIVDVSDDVISWSVDKERDLGTESANTFGLSTASSFSLTLDNSDNRYNFEDVDSFYWGLLHPGVRFDVALRFDEVVPEEGIPTTGLVAWYRADAITGVPDGGAVGTWPDSSGRGKDATQATASRKPTYVAAGLNGRPVVRFDGTDDVLVGPCPIGGTTLTVCAVVKPLAWNNYNRAVSLQDSAATNDYNNAGSAIPVLRQGGTNNLGAYRKSAMLSKAGVTLGSTYVVTSKWDGTNHTFYLGGVAQTPVASSGTFSIDDIYIGWTKQAVAGEAWNGDIAEILIYDRALSDAERQQVERALASKYSLSINFTPISETIKIGTFYADSWQLSSDTSNVSVSCRDSSRFLQDKNTPQLFYENEPIRDVIRDILERCGIDDFVIDTSGITLEDMIPQERWTDIENIEDIVCVPKRHYIWADTDKTYWQLLQEIALSDLGVFYFDERDRFIFIAKDTITSTPIDATFPDVSGMVAWYKADAINLNDGDQISYLKDVSGNGYDVYQSNSTNKPTFIKNGINGRPTIRVQGTQYLATTRYIGSITDQATIFVVGAYNANPPSTESSIVHFNYEATPGFSIKGDSNDLVSPHSFMFQYVNPSGGVSQIITSDIYTTDTVCLVGGIRDDGTISLRVNGELIGTTSASSFSIIGPQRFFIGSPFVSAMFDIGEVILFSQALDDDTISSIESYLMYRWGITSERKELHVVDVIDDSHHIITSEVSTSLAKNDVEISYFVPKMSKHRVGLWQPDTIILSSTTLGGSISMADTEIPAGDISDWYPSGWIKIDDEIIKYESRSDTAFKNCKRGQLGTDPSSHDGGTTIYEIREIDVDYALSPATDFSLLNTSEEYTDVILSQFGPFRGKLMILTRAKDDIIVQGAQVDNSIEGLIEAIVLAGRAIEQPEEKRVHKVNTTSINRWGQNKIQISIPWIQSVKHAESLAEYIISTHSYPFTVINLETTLLPHIEIGDLVKVKHSRFTGINARRYFVVVAKSINGTHNNYSMQLSLRSRPRQYALPDKSWKPQESPPFTDAWDPSFDDVPDDITTMFTAENITADVDDPAPTGMSVWFKAEDINLDEEASVTSWTDASGNNRNATYSGTAPVLRKEGFFGRPCVRFTTTTTMDFTISPGLTAATVIVVGKYNKNSFTPNVSIVIGGADPRIGIVADPDDATTPHSIKGTSSGFTTNFTITSTDSYHNHVGWVSILTYDGTQGALFIDGNLIGSGTASAHTLYTSWRMGAPSQTTGFDIAEVRIYPYAMQEQDIKTLTRYLAIKWGIIKDAPYEDEPITMWVDDIAGEVLG